MNVHSFCEMQDSEINKTVELSELPSFMKMVDVTPIYYLHLVSTISGAVSEKLYISCQYNTSYNCL